MTATRPNPARESRHAQSRGHERPIGLGGAVFVVVVLAMGALFGALAGRQAGLAVGLAVLALMGLALMARPDVATLFVIGLIYSNAVVVAVRFHGVPEVTAVLVPLLLAVPVAYALVVERRPLIITPAFVLLLVYLVVQILGTLLARDTVRAVESLETLIVEGVVLYLLVSNAVRSTDLLRRAVWMVLVVGAAMASLSLYQQTTGTVTENYLGFAQVGGDLTDPHREVYHLAGPVGEKNRYAQILVVLIPLGLTLYLVERRRWQRAAAAMASVLIVIAMMLTFSRGAALALAAVLLGLLWRRRLRARQFVAVGLVLLVLLALFPQYRERLATLERVGGATAAEGEAGGADGSIRSRTTTNIAALLVFLEHPVVGTGPGMFPLHYREHAEWIGIRARMETRQAHNLYLGVASESGVLGLLAFGGIVVVTMRQLVRARRRLARRDPGLAGLAEGMLFAVVAYLASGVFLHLSFARYFWLLMALAGAAGHVLGRTADALDTAEAPIAESGVARLRRPSGAGPPGASR